VAFSPDGSTLAVVKEGKVKLYDPGTGNLRATCQGEGVRTSCVAFSPDGAKLATGGPDTKVRLWDAKTGQVLFVLEGHTAPVKSLAFSPDGRLLASAAGKQGQPPSRFGRAAPEPAAGAEPPKDLTELKLWEVGGRGKHLADLSGHTGFITCVAFSPDGKTLASTGHDKKLKLWDVAGRKDIRTVEHPGAVMSVAFAPDGRTAATACDLDVKLWDTTAWTEKATLEQAHDDRINAVTFSPDGKLLATASTDRTAKLWDLGTRQEKAVLTAHPGYVIAVSFGGNNLLATGAMEGTAKLWDVSTATEVRTLEAPPPVGP
jgi:WD40 repeat protein